MIFFENHQFSKKTFIMKQMEYYIHTLFEVGLPQSSLLSNLNRLVLFPQSIDKNFVLNIIMYDI